MVRNEKKKLRNPLTHIHQQIQPIGNNISLYSEQVSQLLQHNFGILMKKTAYERVFEKMFPLLTFEQFEQKIEDRAVVLKRPLDVEDSTILLEREIKLTAPEFNFLQLQILVDMLSVEEWKDEAAVKIRWFNSNREAPLTRFVLYYNVKKKVLKKKYVYKQREPITVQKSNISRNQLQDAAESRNVSILGEGFK